MNNGDILPDSAMLSALISSCCFVYISEDLDGYPRLQVIDGGNGTGVMDPITGLLTEGYAVISRDKNGNVDMDAYFVAGRTEFYQGNRLVRVDKNQAPSRAGADYLQTGRNAPLRAFQDQSELHESDAGGASDAAQIRGQRGVLLLPAEIRGGAFRKRRRNGNVESNHFVVPALRSG